MSNTWAIDSVSRIMAFGAAMLCCKDVWKNLAYLIIWLSRGRLFSRYLVQLLTKEDTASSKCFFWRVSILSISDLAWVPWSILALWIINTTFNPPSQISEKRERFLKTSQGNMFESLNYSYKWAEWGIWENGKGIVEYIKWTKYLGYKSINDKPCVFLLDWWLGLFLPLVASSFVSWKNHFSRILRAGSLPV